LNFNICVSISSLGRTPFSVSLFAFTITMNFIGFSYGKKFGAPPCPPLVLYSYVERRSRISTGHILCPQLLIRPELRQRRYGVTADYETERRQRRIRLTAKRKGVSGETELRNGTAPQNCVNGEYG
jgi:hypothetical protein